MHTLQRTLTLAAVALLVFTGCGKQKTGSIPEPSDSNPSTSTATTSNSANPNATPQAAEHYSGGSKAPEGEYRPADEFGPAQNVPKPVKPEGMSIETAEGMELFINYWNDLRNYAMQTGDVTEIKELVDESFTQEQNFYTVLNQMYTTDGWIIGGGRIIHYNKNLLLAHGNGEYSITANFEVKDSVFWLDGNATYNDNSDSIYDSVDLRIKFENGAWSIISADIVN